MAVLRSLVPAVVALALAACGTEANEAVPQAATAQTAKLSEQDFKLINRLTWGASPADVRAFQQLGRQGWIDAQLRPQSDLRLPDFVQPLYNSYDDGTPMEAQVVALQAVLKRVAAARRDPSISASYQDYSGPIKALRMKAVQRSLLRDIYSPDQLREQMTWFWFNHFNVRMVGGITGAAGWDYVENAIRPRAFGPFCDLVNVTLRHPAMLVYLNNAQNTAQRGNENYARELMELHTLGVDTEYSQADVQTLARLLTGAGLDTDNWPPPPAPKGGDRQGLYVFDPGKHDFGKKVLLGVPIKARGPAEIEEATSMLCRHPATAQRISRRIAQFLVAEAPPEPLVALMAEAFSATDGNIEAVLRAMLAAPEFEQSLGQMFKDPNHYLLSALRMGYAEEQLVDPELLMRELYRSGQDRYAYTTPDGYSLEAAAWNASGQLELRFNHAAQIGSGRSRWFKTPLAVNEIVTAVRSPAPDFMALRTTYGLYPALAPETAAVLAETPGLAERNGLFLASPEFMRR